MGREEVGKDCKYGHRGLHWTQFVTFGYNFFKEKTLEGVG